MPVKRLCFDFLHAGALVGNMDIWKSRGVRNRLNFAFIVIQQRLEKLSDSFNRKNQSELNIVQ